MDNLDLKLKLFGGKPVYAEGYGNITPLTINQIIEFGYTEYMRCLNILCVETTDFFKDVEDLEEVSVFDLLLSLGGEEIENQLAMALNLFLNVDVVLDVENLSAIVELSDKTFKVINRENFDSIREIIKWQNYVNHFEEKTEGFNPANEEARKFKEKMEKLKKQRDAIKKKKQQREGEDEEDNTDLYDIISSVASKSNSINEINVMDLTIYQVYSKFKRMEAIDQYDISIKSILAGAKDVKLKHWSMKIE